MPPSGASNPPGLRVRMLVEALFDPDDVGRTEFITPDVRPRHCRFCRTVEGHLRPDGQVAKFSKDAHALPEAIGNKYLLSTEECDACNLHGSRLESDFTQLVAALRPFSGIEGKDGPVKYRFGTSRSFVAATRDAGKMEIQKFEGDESLRLRRVPDGIAYAIKMGRYRPVNAVRCLARMAFSLLPSGLLDDFEHLRRWIQEEETFTPRFFAAHIPGPRQKLVEADIFATELGGVEALQFMLVYGSEAFCFVLPDATWNQETPAIPPMLSPHAPHVVEWEQLVVRPDERAEQRFELVEVRVPALMGVALPSDGDVQTAAFFRWIRGGSLPGRELDNWLQGEEDEAVRQLVALGFAVPVPP